MKQFIHPRQVLPSLHNKTHFKAAQEYILGESARTRSMVDPTGEVERNIKNAMVRIGGFDKLESLSIRPTLDQFAGSIGS